MSPIGLHDETMISDEEKEAKEKKFFTALATGPFAQSNDALRDADAAMDLYTQYMIAN